MIGDGPDRVVVTVVMIERGRVRLGIEAGRHIKVDRAECREDQREGGDRG